MTLADVIRTRASESPELLAIWHEGRETGRGGRRVIR
jgi:hypothetical protein